MPSTKKTLTTVGLARPRAKIEGRKAQANAAKAAEKTRRKKYLSKVKAWLKGGSALKEFERLEVVREGTWILFRDKQEQRIVRVDKDRPGIISHVFRAKDGTGRLVIVRQSSLPEQFNRLKIEATTLIPEESMVREEKQFFNSETVIKQSNDGLIAYSNGFVWTGDYYSKNKELKSAGETEAPDFIKGQGFALFLDAISTTFAARTGARKMYSLADTKGKGISSHKIRGYRKPTEEERRQFQSSTLVRHGVHNSTVLRVKDIPILKPGVKKTRRKK